MQNATETKTKGGGESASALDGKATLQWYTRLRLQYGLQDKDCLEYIEGYRERRGAD